MPIVVGVRFKDSGKTYHFDPAGLVLIQGDHVIVETVRGQELAKVAYPQQDITDADVVGDLKPVVRRAEQSDFERMRLLQARHDEVLARCKEKVAQHDLPMRLVKAEYSFDGSRLTFYFTAEKRVDFRNLVRDLARTFKTRIELRQIGPRDEAKLLGGIGPCGRLLCCATFLPDYARVSIKMAKDQDLPLNPSKISGVCGRLLCCLSYEHDQYLEIKAELPRLGAWVQTAQGPGEVVVVNVVKETVLVELEGQGEQIEATAEQIREAGGRVNELARSRAEQGQAAPIARQQRNPGAAEHERPSNEVLEALELLGQGQAGADVSPGRKARPAPERRPAGERKQVLPQQPTLPPPTVSPRPALQQPTLPPQPGDEAVGEMTADERQRRHKRRRQPPGRSEEGTE